MKKTDYSEFVPNVHFDLIPIKNLVSNQEYQRNISMKHVRKTANNFDLYQINPVKVSRRDGVNYVFNGQHTVEIIATVSGSRDTPVWCMIYDDLEYSHEAEIFANQMKYVKGLLPYEIFQANIEAGSDEQLIIRDLVESYGLTISSSRKPGTICAVSSLEKVYENHGFNVLDRTLRLIIGTWEGEDLSLSSNMIYGVSKLVVAYGNKLKDDVFKEKLSKIPCKELIRNAKERKSGSLGYAEAILIYYNKRSRFGLSILDLYEKKKKKKEKSDDDHEMTDAEIDQTSEEIESKYEMFD